MTALVVLFAVGVALAVYAVASWLLGPDPDLEKPWFPENHWRQP